MTDIGLQIEFRRAMGDRIIGWYMAAVAATAPTAFIVAKFVF